MANWLSDEKDALWSAFPVDAVPRPIVLLDQSVRIEGGFEDVNAKEAWAGGRIGWSTEIPPGVSALLPARGPAYTDRELAITEIAPTTAEFRCDRGPRELHAYRLTVTGMYGSCVVLSPQVDCWWSQAASDEGPRSAGIARIADDQVTVQFSAFGGALTEFQRAEFQEHGAYVVGRAITSERAAPKGSFVTAIGIRRMVTGRLTSPLEGRVLVDTEGRPLSVASINAAT